MRAHRSYLSFIVSLQVFAATSVTAVSKFWYLIHQMHKMKKTTGEILDVNEITEKNDRTIKHYGIWLRYNSRSGTHNMYREYRDLTLTGAVDQLYSEMAGRHRCRPRSIQIIRTGIVAAKDTKRPPVKQFQNATIKFPLVHRIPRAPEKKFRATFLAHRPSTFKG
jgi:large subunit ribosomal protein L18Ae